MNSYLLFWEALRFAILLGVFLLFYTAIRRRTKRLRDLLDGSKGDFAVEVLDRRYARGEIAREEYLAVSSRTARPEDR